MIHWVQEHRPLDRQLDQTTFYEVITTSTQDPNILAILQKPLEQSEMMPRPGPSSRSARGDSGAHGTHGIFSV
jgi:hypothetical protein